MSPTPIRNIPVNNDLPINSIHVISQHWGLILALLAFIIWNALLIFAHLKKNTGFQYTDLELTALAMGGWPLPALLFSFIILFLSAFIPAGFILVIAAAIILSSGWLAVRTIWENTSAWALAPVLIFLLFAFLRLGFVANLLMPLYFDSAEHYRIIQELLAIGNEANRTWPTTSYYHLGYHAIIAALTIITSAEPSQIMLLFGQLILAAIPLPIYFLIHRATFSKSAAILGVTLAAFGWFMPAHAVNWGKYPALLSLVLIQFAFGIAILKKRWMFALTALAAMLIHTRSIILLIMLGAAWFLSFAWEKQDRNKRIVSFGLTVTLLGLLIVLVFRNQILSPILDPYLIWVTLLTGLLAAAVFQAFPHLVIFPILAILFMLAGIFIPVTSSLTLLDRPLVEMVLFLPLAFLGGLGSIRLPKFATPILAVFIIVNAWMTISFAPSKCCQLVSQDDSTALNWMGRHIPKDAVIAIAGVDLNVNAFGRPMRGAGIDAGIWIKPLTKNETLALPNTTDFASTEAHDLLCRNGVTHIYVGERPQSFSPDFAEMIPEWYETIFSLPKTHIVKVLNCGK